MDLRVLKGAFNHYGLGLEDCLTRRLFAGKVKNGENRSAKMIRDSLVHSITKRNIDEVDRQFSQLIADMDVFLLAIHK